jgi:hypothetical protein
MSSNCLETGAPLDQSTSACGKACHGGDECVSGNSLKAD